MSGSRYDKLLRDVSRSGVFRAPSRRLPELLAAADTAGFAIIRIDLSAVRNKKELFERLATAFALPGWFGRNWDALADCLGDLSWLPAGGYLVLLEHCDGFRASRGADFATVLRVFAAASDAWRDLRVPFWVLVDTRSDAIVQLQEIG